jgi:hypothetical protein
MLSAPGAESAAGVELGAHPSLGCGSANGKGPEILALRPSPSPKG